MRLVCMSDIHTKFSGLNVPDGDVFIFAGDYSFPGNENELVNFGSWLRTLPHKTKIVISGNHDRAAERLGKTLTAQVLTDKGKDKSIIYLQDSFHIIDGIKFYGSPYTHEFGNWAFMRPKNRMAKIWGNIPLDTDVLITHGPPLNKCDYSIYNNEHAGCGHLDNRIKLLTKLKVHVFGHIHHSYGCVNENGVLFANASTCTERYDPINPAVVVDI
jgi:Icc-related predicted phosphoesterase